MGSDSLVVDSAMRPCSKTDAFTCQCASCLFEPRIQTGFEQVYGETREKLLESMRAAATKMGLFSLLHRMRSLTNARTSCSSECTE